LERRDPSELLADSDEEANKGDHGYSESGRDDDEPSTGIEDSESDEEKDEENNEHITEILQTQYLGSTAETTDEGSERDLDDDQMIAMDDKLAIIFRDRAGERKSKGVQSRIQVASVDEHPESVQREAIHFKNRIMDLLDTFVRRQPASPHILQFLVPLLALTFSDEKQVSEKAAGLMSRIARLKEVPSSVDIASASSILNDLHIRTRRVHSRDAIAIVSRCSLYVSRALLHVGADEAVQVAYATSLVDFTERKTSDLNGQFFCDFIKRYPRVAWGMRAALLAAPVNAVNAYRQGQAYMLLETLLKNLVPHLVSVVFRFVILFGSRS
jgi:DNA polymerase phi